MPKVGNVEKKIQKIEHVKVHFIKDGKNVRSEVDLPKNYSALKMTKNSATVSFLIDKLKWDFPGYDFVVYDGADIKARGNTTLARVRDTYLDD